MTSTSRVRIFKFLSSQVTVALLLAIGGVPALGVELTPAEYPFEYQDPIIATLTTAMAHGSPEAFNLDVKVGKIQVLPGRDQIPLFEGRGRLYYNFYPQKNRTAPLIFVVAGLGGQGGSGYSAFVAELLAHQGYQVLTVSSPFFWNFILSAGSTGLPGLTDEDARDLYRAMKAELADVRARFGIKPRAVGAVGFSMGALELAYVSQIDKLETATGSGIGLSRILMVNPPVDIAHDASLFDQLLVAGLQRFSTKEIDTLAQKVFNFGVTIYNANSHEPGYFSNLQSRLPLTPEESRFLIGVSFHDTLAETIFMSQQIHDLGILKEKATSNRRDARMAEARSFLFQQYIGQFVMPQWAIRNQVAAPTIDDLKAHANFAPIAEAIAADDRVYLMHNLDDPLLTPEHIELLRKTFGARATLYPLGGHVGNVWYSRNIDDLMKAFKTL